MASAAPLLSPRPQAGYGIFGFAKFHRGYYLVLITKRRRVALIGAHYIYKIEDTEMIPIFNPALCPDHPNEVPLSATVRSACAAHSSPRWLGPLPSHLPERRHLVQLLLQLHVRPDPAAAEQHARAGRGW